MINTNKTHFALNYKLVYNAGFIETSIID